MRRATLHPMLLRDRGGKRGAALVSMLLGNRGGVCAALDPVLLGYRGEKDAQPLTQCSWRTSEENARPSAQCSRGTGEENPVLLRTREENDVQPSTGSSRSSLATEQKIKADHPWIY